MHGKHRRFQKEWQNTACLEGGGGWEAFLSSYLTDTQWLTAWHAQQLQIKAYNLFFKKIQHWTLWHQATMENFTKERFLCTTINPHTKFSCSNTLLNIGKQSVRQLVNCAQESLTFYCCVLKGWQSSSSVLLHFLHISILGPSPNYANTYCHLDTCHNVLFTERCNTRLPLNGTFCGWPFQTKWWLILSRCVLQALQPVLMASTSLETFHFAQMSAFWIHAEAKVK